MTNSYPPETTKYPNIWPSTINDSDGNKLVIGTKAFNILITSGQKLQSGTWTPPRAHSSWIHKKSHYTPRYSTKKQHEKLQPPSPKMQLPTKSRPTTLSTKSAKSAPNSTMNRRTFDAELRTSQLTM
ncbi:hypothetical protein BC941DRAFT_474791 [Chlamydoabsidia padenii]|nr:hypothetical protein BC941DRAFT_474791 [Chlamydoabsidia padenii]